MQFTALIDVDTASYAGHATVYRQAIREELIEDTLSHWNGEWREDVGVIRDVTVDQYGGQPEGLPAWWRVQGPFLKAAAHYLAHDGGNPDAAQPGYGWPVGSTCWYWILLGDGARLYATGATLDAAWARALIITNAADPAREEGAVR